MLKPSKSQQKVGTYKGVAVFSKRFGHNKFQSLDADGQKQFQITNEMVQWFTKLIFIDNQKMNYDAKKGCKRLGINPLEFKEKTMEEFKYNSKLGDTDQIIEMRYIHAESQRRKKLKILAEFIRNNK